MYTETDICEKCADKVNIHPYIELDDYLVIEESSDKLAMIRKDTGEKKLLPIQDA